MSNNIVTATTTRTAPNAQAVGIVGGSNSVLSGNVVTATAAGTSGNTTGIDILNSDNVTVQGNSLTATATNEAYALSLTNVLSSVSAKISENTLNASSGVAGYHTWLGGSHTVDILSGSTGDIIIAGTSSFNSVTGSISYTAAA